MDICRDRGRGESMLSVIVVYGVGGRLTSLMASSTSG